MNYARRREIYTIDWKKEATFVKISKAEALELMEWYKENGESTRAKIQRPEFLDEGRYRIEKSGNTGRLYCRRKSLYVFEWDL